MYPATPGIYPYLHTLSLHDALPISAHGEAERNDMTTRRLDFNQKRRAPADLLQKRGKAGRAFLCSLEQYARSEEHTSELQSLMRISYAVFCLKKKNKKQNRNNKKAIMKSQSYDT